MNGITEGIAYLYNNIDWSGIESIYAPDNDKSISKVLNDVISFHSSTFNSYKKYNGSILSTLKEATVRGAILKSLYPDIYISNKEYNIQINFTFDFTEDKLLRDMNTHDILDTLKNNLRINDYEKLIKEIDLLIHNNYKLFLKNLNISGIHNDINDNDMNDYAIIFKAFTIFEKIYYNRRFDENLFKFIKIDELEYVFKLLHKYSCFIENMDEFANYMYSSSKFKGLAATDLLFKYKDIFSIDKFNSYSRFKLQWPIRSIEIGPSKKTAAAAAALAGFIGGGILGAATGAILGSLTQNLHTHEHEDVYSYLEIIFLKIIEREFFNNCLSPFYDQLTILSDGNKYLSSAIKILDNFITNKKYTEILKNNKPFMKNSMKEVNNSNEFEHGFISCNIANYNQFTDNIAKCISKKYKIYNLFEFILNYAQKTIDTNNIDTLKKINEFIKNLDKEYLNNLNSLFPHHNIDHHVEMLLITKKRFFLNETIKLIKGNMYDFNSIKDAIIKYIEFNINKEQYTFEYIEKNIYYLAMANTLNNKGEMKFIFDNYILGFKYNSSTNYEDNQYNTDPIYFNLKLNDIPDAFLPLKQDISEFTYVELDKGLFSFIYDKEDVNYIKGEYINGTKEYIRAIFNMKKTEIENIENLNKYYEKHVSNDYDLKIKFWITFLKVVCENFGKISSLDFNFNKDTVRELYENAKTFNLKTKDEGIVQLYIYINNIFKFLELCSFKLPATIISDENFDNIKNSDGKTLPYYDIIKKHLYYYKVKIEKNNFNSYLFIKNSRIDDVPDQVVQSIPDNFQEITYNNEFKTLIDEAVKNNNRDAIDIITKQYINNSAALQYLEDRIKSKQKEDEQKAQSELISKKLEFQQILNENIKREQESMNKVINEIQQQKNLEKTILDRESKINNSKNKQESIPETSNDFEQEDNLKKLMEDLQNQNNLMMVRRIQESITKSDNKIYPEINSPFIPNEKSNFGLTPPHSNLIFTNKHDELLNSLKKQSFNPPINEKSNFESSSQQNDLPAALRKTLQQQSLNRFPNETPNLGSSSQQNDLPAALRKTLQQQSLNRFPNETPNLGSSSQQNDLPAALRKTLQQQSLNRFPNETPNKRNIHDASSTNSETSFPSAKRRRRYKSPDK